MRSALLLPLVGVPVEVLGQKGTKTEIDKSKQYVFHINSPYARPESAVEIKRHLIESGFNNPVVFVSRDSKITIHEIG